MKKVIALAAFLFLAFSFYSFAQNEEEDLDAKYAAGLLAPGTQVPEFTLTDNLGQTRSIQDFRGKKVVLLFWASWCPDCRAEVPLVKTMQADADPEKVVFVSVSFDRAREAFENYVRDNDLGGVQLFDPAGMKKSEIGAAYHIKWIPSLYLIDEDGKVIFGTVVADKVAKVLYAN